MNLSWELIGKTVVGLGGWTVITVALSSWIGQRIAQKLNLKWQHEYQSELEGLKLTLLNNYEILKTSITSFSTNYHASQEKRILGIEIVWGNMLELREYLSPLITFYTVLLPEEYDEIVFGTKDDPFLLSKLDYKSYKPIIDGSSYAIEKNRPFLGEYFWGLYSGYRAFCLRNIFIFLRGKERGGITPWFEDKALLGLVEMVIGKDEISNINLSNIDSFSRILNLMELKILEEMNKLISGQLASNDNLKQAKKILMEVQKIEL